MGRWSDAGPEGLGASRWPRWALVLSLGVHALLLLVRVEGYLPPVPERRETVRVDLVPLPREPREVTQPLMGPLPSPSPEGAVPPAPRRVAPPSRLPLPAPTPPRVAVTQRDVPARDNLVARDSAPAAARAPAVTGGLRPARGEGSLWIDPLPVAPRELAQRLSRSHAELVDSAVTAIVQAYLDSVLAEARATALPEWTTELGVGKVGLDQKFIYLGPIKIPTLLLALLDIPAGQFDLVNARRFNAMRADLAYAARRAATLAEFKEQVRLLRVERERQREFERNQRRNPSDSSSRRP